MHGGTGKPDATQVHLEALTLRPLLCLPGQIAATSPWACDSRHSEWLRLGAKATSKIKDAIGDSPVTLPGHVSAPGTA